MVRFNVRVRVHVRVSVVVRVMEISVRVISLGLQLG